MHKCFLILLGLLLNCSESASQSQRSSIPVIYSPYVYQVQASLQKYPSKESYTIAHVYKQIQILSKEFSVTVTLGMGLARGNKDKPWNQTDVQSLIATTAALYNSRVQKVHHIKIIQGIRMNRFWEKELEHAVISSTIANELFPGTVIGYCFNVDDLSFKNEATLEQKLTSFVSLATQNITIGLRLVDSDCQLLLNSNKFKYFLAIIDQLIFQHFSPSKIHHEQLTDQVLNIRETLTNQLSLKHGNRSIEVFIETGWPTMAVKYSQPGKHSAAAVESLVDFVQFWDNLRNHVETNTTRVVMREAFDQPFLCFVASAPFAECSYGYWFMELRNQDPQYVRKRDLITDKLEGAKEGNTLTLTLLVIGIAILTAMLLFGGYLVHRNTRNKEVLSSTEYFNFLWGIPIQNQLNNTNEEHSQLFPYNVELEIPRDKFIINKSKIIGIGAFGTVFQGTIEGTESLVAFKTMKVENTITIKAILAEIKIMSYIGPHPHIVSLLGAYTKEARQGIAYLATEFCSKGSLLNYLRGNSSRFQNAATEISIQNGSERYTADPTSSPRNSSVLNKTTVNISEQLMYKWAYEICEAMEYLQNKRVVHGDLATRNILLTSSLSTKLTDFGLSRRLYTNAEYVKTSRDPMPWRWMAVESLNQMVFTAKSDMWSFGVTIWEILTLGDVPYGGLGWRSDFTSMLIEGLRPPKPRNCSDEIYSWLMKCWNITPEERPDFSAVLSWMEG